MTDPPAVQIPIGPAPQPMTVPQLFGSNSDGGMRLMEFLDVMCLGCKHESVKHRAEGEGGGWGCAIVTTAISEFPVPQWRQDIRPMPEHVTGPDGLDPDQPWPVCTDYQPRKRRADRGLRRGPRVPFEQGELFG